MTINFVYSFLIFTTSILSSSTLILSFFLITVELTGFVNKRYKE